MGRGGRGGGGGRVNQHVQRAALSISERIFHSDEKSESSAPSGIQPGNESGKLHTASIIHHKGAKEPCLDGGGGSVGRRVCKCTYIFVRTVLSTDLTE